MRQIDCLLDRQSLQRLLTALNHLTRAEQLDLGSTQAEAIQRDRDLLDLETPVLHGTLSGQLVHHVLDLSDLFLRRDASHGQGIAHASTLPNRVRDTIK